MLDTLRSEILALEAAMRPLEPDRDERSRLGQMTRAIAASVGVLEESGP